MLYFKWTKMFLRHVSYENCCCNLVMEKLLSRNNLCKSYPKFSGFFLSNNLLEPILASLCGQVLTKKLSFLEWNASSVFSLTYFLRNLMTLNTFMVSRTIFLDEKCILMKTEQNLKNPAVFFPWVLMETLIPALQWFLQASGYRLA